MFDPRTAPLGGHMWIYVRGATYVCAHAVATRRIPKTVLAEWQSDYDEDLETSAAALVKAGLWVDMGDGYHVPDLGFFVPDAEGDILGLPE